MRGVGSFDVDLYGIQKMMMQYVSQYVSQLIVNFKLAVNSKNDADC